MHRLANAAVRGAEALPGSILGALAADVRAEAWSALANALRVEGKLAESDATWEQVDAHLQEGSGDPLLQADLLQLRASLRLDQRRPSEAAELVRRARRLYAMIGEHDRAGAPS